GLIGERNFLLRSRGNVQESDAQSLRTLELRFFGMVEIAGGQCFAVGQQEHEIHSTFERPFLDDVAVLQAPRFNLFADGANEEILAGAEVKALLLVMELERNTKSPIATA